MTLFFLLTAVPQSCRRPQSGPWCWSLYLIYCHKMSLFHPSVTGFCLRIVGTRQTQCRLEPFTTSATGVCKQRRIRTRIKVPTSNELCTIIVGEISNAISVSHLWQQPNNVNGSVLWRQQQLPVSIRNCDVRSPINGRLIVVRLNARPRNITLIDSIVWTSYSSHRWKNGEVLPRLVSSS